MHKQPLISVIMPLYNVEQYVSAAIDSVLSQTVGFEKSTELILVDDGSTDGTLEKCRYYVEKYPSNICLLKQKNRGVSAARNKGFNHASGKYIHFFDGDDILSKNFQETAVEFLQQNREVDFVAAKLKFFDQIIDSHPLNYKFRKSRTIDLTKEPDNPILHVISCIFRRSALENISFDERLSIAEDVKFLSDVLVNKKKYGVISKATYYYRKRNSSTSAIGGKEHNKSYYTLVPKLAYEHILESWTGHVLPAEYVILYDLAYRLEQKQQSILNSREGEIYKRAVLSLATKCSAESIVLNKYLNVHQKLYILRIKYGHTFNGHIKIVDGITYFDGYRLYNYNQTNVHVDFLTRQKGENYKIEGYIDGPVNLPGVSFMADVSGKRTGLHFVTRAQREQSFLGDIYYNGGAFEIGVDISTNATLSFLISAPKKDIVPHLRTGPFTKLGALKWTYRRERDRLIKRLPDRLTSYSYSRSRHFFLELRTLWQIILNWRLNTMRARFAQLLNRNLKQLSLKAKILEIAKPFAFSAEAVFYIPRAILLRIGYYIAKSFKHRPIWIVSDRPMAAGDNGEALFRYIMGQKDCPADVYFAISKKSADYARLKTYGPVINIDGLGYKLKFLLADKIISSQADIETTNPFMRLLNHYVDLFNFDFIFLQHGIIRHDHTSWLSRFDKNINLFITSARKEYDSILDYPYYYSPEQVLLSGLPRYDYLKSQPNKKLILAPTYRKNLARMPTNKKGLRQYDPRFKMSDYRNFYNNLMNDIRLKSALKEAGMIGEFYLHPNFSAQIHDFDENEVFKLARFPHDYNAAFREGEVLVSDHSSVVFDFAYLKKPVLYAHFDADTFFDNHTYDRSNFFSDERDGFGNVYYDYDTLVIGIVKLIQNGCKMQPKYKRRVDNFFKYKDKKNSFRIYERITK